MGYLQRILWWGTLLWGAFIPWLSFRPPLIDLPQHAGQVALLNDFFSGVAQWQALVSPNFFTPYLTTYFLIFLFNQLLPLMVAIKLILTICFICFVGMCVALRKEFKSAAQLDWMFFIGFFGFAWTFGFISFLLSAPIGLLLIWFTHRWLNSTNRKYGIGIVLVGGVLLLSHGLMFGFIFIICCGMVAQVRLPLVKSVEKLIPLSVIALLCLIFMATSAHYQPKGIDDGFAFAVIDWKYNLLIRVKEFLQYPVDQSFRWDLPIVPMMLVIPWLLGLRFHSFKSSALIPMAVLLGMFFCAPTYALKIQYIYQRFAIFFLPFYVLLFCESMQFKKGKNNSDFKGFLASLALIIGVWSLYWTCSNQMRSFSEESKPFENMLSHLAPSQRVLYVAINAESDAQNRDNIYLHYGLWYQAEKKGFVDFNFAWTPAMIMRFTNSDTSPIRPGFEWEPIKFNWLKNHGEVFRYFIFKSKDEIDPVIFFSGAKCIPKKIFQEGQWQAYESGGCF